MITTSSEDRTAGRRSRPISYGNEIRSTRNRGIARRGELLHFHSQQGREGGRLVGDLAETADAVPAGGVRQGWVTPRRSRSKASSIGDRRLRRSPFRSSELAVNDLRSALSSHPAISGLPGQLGRVLGFYQASRHKERRGKS